MIIYRQHRQQAGYLTRCLISGVLAVIWSTSPGAEDLQESYLSPESAATEAVIQRHVKAFLAGDLAGVMSDYTDQSVLITPAGMLRGTTEIRRLFQTLIAEFSAPTVTSTILKRHTHGPIAYLTWTAQTPVQHYELATDTFYVVNDRILYQTFAAKTVAKKSQGE